MSFSATKCSLLPFSVSVITLIVAAFATDEPVIFVRDPDCESDDYPSLDSDEFDHDIDDDSDVDAYLFMGTSSSR